jgi:hypothetical protein
MKETSIMLFSFLSFQSFFFVVLFYSKHLFLKTKAGISIVFNLINKCFILLDRQIHKKYVKRPNINFNIFFLPLSS